MLQCVYTKIVHSFYRRELKKCIYIYNIFINICKGFNGKISGTTAWSLNYREKIRFNLKVMNCVADKTFIFQKIIHIIAINQYYPFIKLKP